MTDVVFQPGFNVLHASYICFLKQKDLHLLRIIGYSKFKALTKN